MKVASSIQIPKRVDPKRKQLVKELQNDIKNLKRQNLTTPKRKPSQDYGEYQNLDTLKKKQHMDEAAIRNGKQNDKNKHQNDRIFAHNKSHQIPIRPPINPHNISQGNNQEHILNEQTIRKEGNFLFANIPLVFPMMLDQRMPNLKDPNLGIFTDKERFLITIQQKLDSYLLFVKENRKKKKGQFFSGLKRAFLQNHRIFLEFSHIKKILYVDSSLYSVRKFDESVAMDCLIDIKLNCNDSDTKALRMELKERKDKFPHKLFALKEELKNATGEQRVQIPQVKFEFEAVLQTCQKTLKTSLKSLLDGQIGNKKKIDKFFVLQNKNSQEYKTSIKILQTGIKRVETIIKKDKQINLKLFGNKMFEIKQLNPKQIQSIVDQINFIYRSRSVTNLVFDLLVQELSKKLIISKEVLQKSLEILIEVASKINKIRPFLRQIVHRTGRIIQIERSSMADFRATIVKNDDWMKRFEFEQQMNDDYVKKKLQEERNNVYKEIKESQQKQVIEQNPVQKPSPVDTKIYDFSKVHRFIEKKPIEQEKYITSEQEQQESDQQIGVPRILLLQTQKMIREARRAERNAMKVEKEKEAKNKKDQVQVQQRGQEDRIEQVKSPQKYEFKSTLQNSDQIFYQEDESIKEAKEDQERQNKV